MRKVALEDIKPGDRLGRNVYVMGDSSKGIMKRRCSILTDHDLVTLREQGHLSLYIDYGEWISDIHPEEMLDEHRRQEVTNQVITRFDDIKENLAEKVDMEQMATYSAEEIAEKIADASSPKGKKPLLDHGFLKHIGQMVDSLLSEQRFAASMACLKTVSNYMFEHSLECAVISLLIARHEEVREEHWRHIAAGALMHDIGYIFLPYNVSQNRANLKDVDQKIFERHTLLGYYLLKEEYTVSNIPAFMARDHHERVDGKGYPSRRDGLNVILSDRDAIRYSEHKIHRFASILAVPNIYLHLLADIPIGSGYSRSRAVRTIARMGGTMLNLQAVIGFLSFTPLFHVGAEVEIRNGRLEGCKGMVSKVFRSAPYQPEIVVQIHQPNGSKREVRIDARKMDKNLKARSGGVPPEDCLDLREI